MGAKTSGYKFHHEQNTMLNTFDIFGEIEKNYHHILLIFCHPTSQQEHRGNHIYIEQYFIPEFSLTSEIIHALEELQNGFHHLNKDSR